MSDRAAFLDRVRQAVVEGNQAGLAPPLPERGGLAYQGAGADPVARFCTELTAAGGASYIASDAEAVFRIVMDIVRTRDIQRVVLGCDGVVARLRLGERLTGEGLPISIVNPALTKDEFFAADLGISNVAALIAETGSVVVSTDPNEPRSLSLLPFIHIAVAERSQMRADLFDLFDTSDPPACLSIITGPSKTGDIELKLVTGVHGPGEIHVILCDFTP